MHRFPSAHITGFALLALVLAGCGDKQETADTAVAAVADTTAVAARSLYDRLGGKEAITVVIDDFVANVAADKRINARWMTADIVGV